MRPYPLARRLRVLHQLGNGVSVSRVARAEGIPTSAVRRWRDSEDAESTVAVTIANGRVTGVSIIPAR
ncbi:helix-turn-helix domain-containing protein [Pseudonocardia ailaonensis]